ncbi:MAG: S41 family peptidase [Ruminococcus callidus]
MATYRDGTTKTLVESDATECSLPMTVIVNGNTASAAELFTASLRDFGKASVVGTQTFGKGIMQVTQSMPSGGALTLTVATYRPLRVSVITGRHQAGRNHGSRRRCSGLQRSESEKDPQLKKAIEMVQAK